MNKKLDIYCLWGILCSAGYWNWRLFLLLHYGEKWKLRVKEKLQLASLFKLMMTVAGDQVDYEDGKGNPIEWREEKYQPFNMVQPASSVREYVEKYFLMNHSYEWVEVDRVVYNNPSDEKYINNKARMNPDGLVSITVVNIGMRDLADIIALLAEKFKEVAEKLKETLPPPIPLPPEIVEHVITPLLKAAVETRIEKD